MFAIPALVLLLVFDYLKPQEYVPILGGLPVLYVLTGLALLGFIIDLRLGLARLIPAPQLPLAMLFVAWSVFTDLPLGTAVVAPNAMALLIPFSLFLLIAHVVQTFRMLRWMTAMVLAIGVFLAFVGTHQGFASWGCHRLTYNAGYTSLVYDGRECSEQEQGVCQRGDAEPGVDYRCERVGLLGTQSIQGRVRFRGAIQDPNELALAVTIVIPLAFAFFDRRRTVRNFLLLAMTIGLAGFCAVFTRSRGGQVVFLLVLAVYFVNRFGKRGLIAGVMCALPIVVLGGRNTDEAAGSTMERLECWARGLEMFQRSPVVGVGLGQFTEHHYLTAHNSYVLTAAELGLPGMILWSCVVYISLKIPIQVLRARSNRGSQAGAVARSWALAFAAALTGVVGGMLFLSYAYKEALWICVGLSGALYQAVRRHEPSLRVHFRARDLGFVVAVDCLLLAAMTAYTSVKLGA